MERWKFFIYSASLIYNPGFFSLPWTKISFPFSRLHLNQAGAWLSSCLHFLMSWKEDIVTVMMSEWSKQNELVSSKGFDTILSRDFLRLCQDPLVTIPLDTYSPIFTYFTLLYHQVYMWTSYSILVSLLLVFLSSFVWKSFEFLLCDASFFERGCNDVECEVFVNSSIKELKNTTLLKTQESEVCFFNS